MSQAIITLLKQLVNRATGAGGEATAVTLTGSNVADAGKLTAATVDNEITANFNVVSLINDGPNELIIGIDEDSTTATNPIYIASGESFSDSLQGSSFHYSVASGSAVFRYLLR